MAAKSLNVGDFHVGHQDTLTLTFLESGTFCSPDKDNFTPPLPDGQFFYKGNTWPTSGVATPTDKKAKKQTKYTFHQSNNPPIQSPCQQGTGVGVGGSGGLAGDNVIHIP
jgi:hypothetical protein